MKAALVVLAALATPVTGVAQDILAEPRAMEALSNFQTYDSLLPDLAGTPVQPLPSEVGMVLLVRMFRLVCLGLEGGAALGDVIPDGFTSHPAGPFYFGVGDTSPDGPRVLSPTGDVEIDEVSGHPTIWLTPEPSGMTCRLQWQVETPPDEARQVDMARIMEQWLPYELTLIRVAAPDFFEEPPTTGFAEYDRPCGDRWCPVTAIYSFPSGRVSIETTLNITAIQGDLP